MCSSDLRRARVVTYDFTHHVWYLALDLDEQTRVNRALPLLSFNRRNLLELRDLDHLHDGSGGLRSEISRRLASLRFDPTRMRVTLIAYPRVFGYVFNPVSFYLCHDASGTLRAVLAEVHNTHGDRKVYEFLPLGGRGPVFAFADDGRVTGLEVPSLAGDDEDLDTIDEEDDEESSGD